PGRRTLLQRHAALQRPQSLLPEQLFPCPGLVAAARLPGRSGPGSAQRGLAPADGCGPAGADAQGAGGWLLATGGAAVWHACRARGRLLRACRLPVAAALVSATA